MTPIVAAGLGLSILAGFGGVDDRVIIGETGIARPNFKTYGSPYPSPYGTTPRRTTPNYTAPRFPSAPKPPMAPTMPQSDLFKPYKPRSVYSNRGGIDSYPAPRKPPGYIDLR